jgi:hypothetical protein
MKNDKTNPEIKFFIGTGEHLSVCTYDTITKKIIKTQNCECSGLMPKYSFEHDTFYVPIDNALKIYDSSLEHLISILKYDSQITRVELFNHKLAIYEENMYHELDLHSLTPAYQYQTKTSQQILKNEVPFNIIITPQSNSFIIANSNKHHQLKPKFFDKDDLLQIWEFPFDDYIECFSTVNYKKYIRSFAEYYFAKIKETNYKDDLFGPINPLIMSIYHNDHQLLEELLTKYRYPHKILKYVSPLSYAFENRNVSIIKQLCLHLSQCEYSFELTREDFDHLLASSYGYCHQLMGTIPKKAESDIFPSFSRISSSLKLFNVNWVQESLLMIKRGDSAFEKKNEKNEKNKSSEMKEIIKKDVNTYSIPFKYSFAAGSVGCIKFLSTFSESNNEDFLLSQWKNVVLYKWKQQYYIHIFIAFIYWINSAFIITSMVFVKKSKSFQYASVGLIIFFLLLEILQFTSYCFFKIKK